MKVVIVSGTPGTGKTTLSRKLTKRLKFRYIDVNKIISEYNLSEGYDRKRKTRIVNVNKLNKVLIKEINILTKNYIIKNSRIFNPEKYKLFFDNGKYNEKLPIKNKKFKKNIKKYKGIIIDSHLSHYLPRKYVDFCIVTKCDIKELNKRLKKKKYDKNKIQENLQAEIFDICLNEARQRKHKILIADTTKGFNINKIAQQLGGH